MLAMTPSLPSNSGGWVGERLLVATTHTHTHFIFASGLSSSFGTENKKRTDKVVRAVTVLNRHFFSKIKVNTTTSRLNLHMSWVSL